MAGQCATQCSRVLFRVGQVLLVIGLVMVIVSCTTTYWVVRPEVDWDDIDSANETIVTLRYGIFQACKQKGPDGDAPRKRTCGALWDYLYLINENTVRYIQFLMVVSSILYSIGVAVEIVQILPIKKFRNFLAMNRVSEAFTSVAAVLILHGMVVFAGEIKNKAERMPGQDEEKPGWSFILCLMGLLIAILSVILTAMFRELPIQHPNAKGGSWVKKMG